MECLAAKFLSLLAFVPLNYQSMATSKYPSKMHDLDLFQQKNNNLPHFQNQLDINS